MTSCVPPKLTGPDMCEMVGGGGGLKHRTVSSETLCRVGMGGGDPGAVYLPCIYSHARRWLSKAI